MASTPQSDLAYTPSHRVAALFMVGSAFSFGVMIVFAKHGTASVHALLASATRSAIIAGLTFPFIAAPAWAALRTAWAQLLVRGLLEGIGVALWYRALLYIDLSVAVSISYLAPILINLYDALRTHRRLGRVEIVGMGSCLGGLLVFFQPQGAVDLVGLMLATGSMVLFVAHVLVGRRLTAVAGSFTIVSLTSVFACLTCLALLLAQGDSVTALAVQIDGSLLIVAFASFVANLLLLTSLANKQATRQIYLYYLQIFFALGIEYMFHGTSLTAPSISGGVLIFIGVALCLRTGRR